MPGIDYRRTAARIAALLLLMALLSPVVATAWQPAPVTPPALSSDTDMPPAAGGAPAPAPPIAIRPPRPPQTAATGGPAINLWHGPSQVVGRHGDPQKWFNLLGNVVAAPTASVVELTYRLNGGPPWPLTIGPNDRRLAEPGDFNVELDYTDLLPGDNLVVLRAVDSDGRATEIEATLTYEGGGIVWSPQTLIYDWSTVARIDDLGQVVDGRWVLDGDGVRPTVFEFDRLLALGDLSWRDYTVTVPITIFGIDPSGYKAPSNGPGVGILVRWAGHYDTENGITPFAGWRRLGALAWYRWSKQSGVYSEGLQLLGNRGQTIGTANRRLTPGVTYLFKIEIQSAAAPNTPATYRFKVWPAAEPEPPGWDIAKTNGSGEPTGGSLLLLAHHVDARFGPVRVDLAAVRPPPVLTLTATGDGSWWLDPPGPAYRFGEDVRLSAVAAPGATFAGWSGAVEGTMNPTMLSLFESAAVTATFAGAPAGEAFYVSPARNGAIGGVAFAPADILRFHPATGWSMVFDGSDVGITANLSAFALLDGDILMAFATNQTIPDVGTFAPQDIARFSPTATGETTAGSFRWEFDGSAHDLTTQGEKIDALAVLGDGRLAISTTGTAAVKLPNGTTLKAQDEDALGFDIATATWSLAFDGTLIPGLKGEDINALEIDPATGDLYIAVLNAFNLSGVRGNGKDIVRLSPDGLGGYSASLWWQGSAVRFPGAIDGFALGD